MHALARTRTHVEPRTQFKTHLNQRLHAPALVLGRACRPPRLWWLGSRCRGVSRAASPVVGRRRGQGRCGLGLDARVLRLHHHERHARRLRRRWRGCLGRHDQLPPVLLLFAAKHSGGPGGWAAWKAQRLGCAPACLPGCVPRRGDPVHLCRASPLARLWRVGRARSPGGASNFPGGLA